jgi:hypothetical protein
VITPTNPRKSPILLVGGNTNQQNRAFPLLNKFKVTFRLILLKRHKKASYSHSWLFAGLSAGKDLDNGIAYLSITRRLVITCPFMVSLIM